MSLLALGALKQFSQGQCGHHVMDHSGVQRDKPVFHLLEVLELTWSL